jgi:hypothetical protein
MKESPKIISWYVPTRWCFSFSHSSSHQSSIISIPTHTRPQPGDDDNTYLHELIYYPQISSTPPLHQPLTPPSQPLTNLPTHHSSTKTSNSNPAPSTSSSKHSPHEYTISKANSATTYAKNSKTALTQRD